MADTRDDFPNDENPNMIDRIKESPRTVSALIIILIVAAAIYAFSGDQQNGVAPAADESPAAAEQVEEGESDAATDAETATITPAPIQSPATPVTREQLAESARQLPEARRTESTYVEVAQAGDGITHLARRATTRWLSENQAGFDVTNEHRIYIEDYIQNRLGTQGMSLGQEMEVSFDLVKEAVAASQPLNEQQLRNLSRYTSALS